MSHFRSDVRQRAEELVALYPQARSALLPLLHLAQEQDGYVTNEGIAEVAELTSTTSADVRGTASFYDMFHLEPVGKYVVAVWTNIACLLRGGVEMREHARANLGRAVGPTSDDGLSAVEEADCLADCDEAACVQVNHRYMHTSTPGSFDVMIEQRRGGRLDRDVPTHSTLIRVRRSGGLRALRAEVVEQRAEAKAVRDGRAAKEEE